MLHEVTYQWGQELKQEDSSFTRRLITNALIRKDLDRKDLMDELANDGFGVDVSNKKTPAYLYVVRKIYPLYEAMDAEPTSKAFQESLSNLGMQPPLNLGKLGAIYRLLTFDKPRGYPKLPGAVSAEVNALQAEVNKIGGDYEYCSRSRSDLGGKEYRRCRGLLPSLKARLDEATAKLAAAQAAHQAKMDETASEVLAIMKPEFVRLAAGDVPKIDAMAAEVRALAWMDDRAKEAIGNGLAQDRQAYQVPIQKLGKFYWYTDVFAQFWNGDPVIPVIE
jgi:hypothetical protein